MEVKLTDEENRHIKEVGMLKDLADKKEFLHKLMVYKDRTYVVVGNVKRKYWIKHEFQAICAEIRVLNEPEFDLVVFFKFFKNYEKIDGLVRVTRLMIHFDSQGKFQMKDRKDSQVINLIPDIVDYSKGPRKSKVLMSTPKSRRVSIYCLESTNVAYPLWKVLIVNLSKFAIRFKDDVKFDFKTLVKISDSVRFSGIVLSGEMKNAAFTGCFRFVIRDMLTNDSVNLYVNFPNKDQKCLDYLRTVQELDVVHVQASRMISQSLSIYCKLSLNQTFSNFSLERKHLNCKSLLCPCALKTTQSFTPNFAPFTMFFEIDPCTLFRAMIKVQVRVACVNLLYFTPKCGNCGVSLVKVIKKCCQNSRVLSDIAMIFMADDSSQVAECQVVGIDNICSLLELKQDCVDELNLLARDSNAGLMIGNSFPPLFKKHLKNLRPILKFCCARPQGKTKARRSSLMYKECLNGNMKEEYIKLNSERDGVCIHLKIYKVYD
jgi:hypothetical protein